MIDQLRNKLPAKVREITGNLQIDQLKLPLTITFGQILPAGGFMTTNPEEDTTKNGAYNPRRFRQNSLYRIR